MYCKQRLFTLDPNSIACLYVHFRFASARILILYPTTSLIFWITAASSAGLARRPTFTRDFRKNFLHIDWLADIIFWNKKKFNWKSGRTTFSFTVVKPSSTSLVTASATSIGVPSESKSAQICMPAELFWLYSTRLWSLSKGLEPVRISDNLHFRCDASKLRMAISRPHLTLGNTEEGWEGKRKRGVQSLEMSDMNGHQVSRVILQESQCLSISNWRKTLSTKEQHLAHNLSLCETET